MPETSQGTSQESGFTVSRVSFEFCPQGIGTLFGALAKARKSFQPLLKTSVNPFFKSKYADLAETIGATVDSLSDNGIAIIQPPSYRRSDGTVEIITVMGHSSGEWVKSLLEMPVSKIDAQAVGSAITYGRRYAYSGMVNIASEAEDDGNAAVSGEFKGKKKAVAEESPEDFDRRTEMQQAISPYQIQAIDEACKRSGKTEEEIIAYLGLIGHKRIEHILKSEFQEFLKWCNGTLKKPSPVPVNKNPNVVKSYQHAWAPLYGKAKKAGIPEDDVKRYYQEMFSVEHGTELTPLQFKNLEEWVSSQVLA